MVKKLIVFLFVVGMGIGSLSAQLAKTCFTNKIGRASCRERVYVLV